MGAVTTRPADVETFRALARSSPWLWRTARFTLTWDGPGGTVRAWVRRPQGLRVESLDGELLVADTASPGPASGLLTAVAEAGAADAGSVPVPPAPAPAPPAPAPDADGLVRTPRRPPDFSAYDSPMYQSYYWVALLDPRELTDGVDPERADPEPRVGTDVRAVAAVDHHGRPALEALVRPTDAYEPRCGCCALLPNPRTDAEEWGEELERVHPPGHAYPDAFRVRLDAATGICVRIEHVGGTDAGVRYELVLEAVDEPLPDELFHGPGLGLGQRVARVRDRLLGSLGPRPAVAPPRMRRGFSPYLD